MIISRALLLILLPVFAGCQSLPWTDNNLPLRPTERLQGHVQQADGRLLLRTCQGQRSIELLDAGMTGLPDDVQALLADGHRRLFADVRGTLITEPNGAGHMQLSRVYRLQAEGPGCDQADFKRLVLRARGNEPGWNVQVTSRGFLLERPDEPPLALPYIEEQLPGGRISFSSEANRQHLNLWVAPQRCIDSASGSISHLTAELRLDDEILRGCAYYGGSRDD